MTNSLRVSYLLLASLIVVYLSETCDGQWCTLCQWSGWGGWSRCSGACGGGSRRRKRNICCLPYPADWGNWCIGNCLRSHQPWQQQQRCTPSCVNGGHFLGGRCNCPHGYSSSSCCRSACPTKRHCIRRACTDPSNVRCETCEGQVGNDASNSLYYPHNNGKQCSATCSWEHQWCWPGTCSNSLASSCRCEDGFKKDPNSAICDIEMKPDLLVCQTGIESVYGEVRNSTSLGNSSSCASETHTFVNIIPKYVSFKITAHFEKMISSVKRNYINQTKLGIVNSYVEVSKIARSGAQTVLKNETLRGGGDCSRVINSSSPQTHLHCVRNLAINTPLENGDRICLQMLVSSGGHFDYTDFGGSYKGTYEFTPVSESKELCFKYDNQPPVHCKAVSSSTCSDLSPLVLSTRITRSPNITARISGWIDPYPIHDRQEQASGIDFYNIHVYGVKHLGPKTLTIDYKRAVFSLNGLKGSHHDVGIVLPHQPEMYVTYLEVHDIAGNVRFSRRFLLYDNVSKLEVREDKYLRVVSASKKTNYKWQIHHGKISLNWKDRFFNNYYVHNDYLVPIKAVAGLSVAGVYEQNTGVLPVIGTESVYGVTGFYYQWSRNNGTKSSWLEIPDFTKQKVSLNPPLKDGETYQIWVKARDIISNTFIESVIVHIDRSVPEITNTWLLREGADQIYVHNDTDLSMMVLQFRAFDVHSGITSVQWSLGTANTTSDIGTGALPVIKLDEEMTCPPDDNCYCPEVGPCEYQNYTLTLDSLVARNTYRGQHDREYFFTLCITNGAMLKSFDHLVVHVNDSRPVVGTIEEGTTGGGLYMGTGLGVVLFTGLVTAVLVILKRKKRICYSKHQSNVARYNAASENSTYDSTNRQGDQTLRYISLGSLTLPPALENPTYETVTPENDQAQPYMSLRCVGQADTHKNLAYETVTPENDQAQPYMSLRCLGQADIYKNLAYETVTPENDQAQPHMSLRSFGQADTHKNLAYETVTPENDQAQPYMSLRCPNQAATPKNPTYEVLERENDHTQLYKPLSCDRQADAPKELTHDSLTREKDQ